MLDHEEKFLFKEEILHLANAVAEPGSLDNIEDLLTDVITSPRFDSEVFTLERSLQVMLGPRAGTTLVGLLTVAPEVFDEVAEVSSRPRSTSGSSRGERALAWPSITPSTFSTTRTASRATTSPPRLLTSRSAESSRAASRWFATTTNRSSSWPMRASSSGS